MKLYDNVKLKGAFAGYDANAKGVIVELYSDVCYLEMFDDDNNTIGMAYDVPLSIIEKQDEERQ